MKKQARLRNYVYGKTASDIYSHSSINITADIYSLITDKMKEKVVHIFDGLLGS